MVHSAIKVLLRCVPTHLPTAAPTTGLLTKKNLLLLVAKKGSGIQVRCLLAAKREQPLLRPRRDEQQQWYTMYVGQASHSCNLQRFRFGTLKVSCKYATHTQSLLSTQPSSSPPCLAGMRTQHVLVQEATGCATGWPDNSADPSAPSLLVTR